MDFSKDGGWFPVCGFRSWGKFKALVLYTQYWKGFLEATRFEEIEAAITNYLRNSEQ